MVIEEVFPDSPFEPWRPVSPEKFKGRVKDRDKILRRIPHVIKYGRTEHFFITGKRGMGKTSFVNYVSRVAQENYHMIPIHINNSGGKTVDELIQKLLDALVREFKKEYFGKKFLEKILNTIQEFKIAGTGVSLKDTNDLIQNIKNHFADFLIKTCEDLPEDYGIFIVIDDLNGLSENEEFTNWYKGFFETMDFNEYHLPIIFTLISYPEEYERLCDLNESFFRIFNIIEIDNLDDKDIAEFFKSSFEEIGIEFEDEVESLQPMIFFSYGMPLIMQLIGDSVFWNAQDDLKINKNTVLLGITTATEELSKKQLKLKLDKIRSKTYINIFIKLAENGWMTFKKSEIRQYLTHEEKKSFEGFLKKAKNLGILESIGKKNSGEYGFVNRLYLVYFLMLASQRDYDKFKGK